MSVVARREDCPLSGALHSCLLARRVLSIVAMRHGESARPFRARLSPGVCRGHFTPQEEGATCVCDRATHKSQNLLSLHNGRQTFHTRDNEPSSIKLKRAQCTPWRVLLLERRKSILVGTRNPFSALSYCSDGYIATTAAMLTTDTSHRQRERCFHPYKPTAQAYLLPPSRGAEDLHIRTRLHSAVKSRRPVRCSPLGAQPGLAAHLQASLPRGKRAICAGHPDLLEHRLLHYLKPRSPKTHAPAQTAKTSEPGAPPTCEDHDPSTRIYPDSHGGARACTLAAQTSHMANLRLGHPAIVPQPSPP